MTRVRMASPIRPGDGRPRLPEVEASLGAEPDMTLSEKEVFYRVAQESLHNIVKHAHAVRVDVQLSRDDDTVVLLVRDDGSGFDATQSYPGHMGLVSFAERATSIAATVHVDSNPAPAQPSACPYPGTIDKAHVLGVQLRRPEALELLPTRCPGLVAELDQRSD